jgi:bacillithiol biosynthesis cysteine-adding enzyme BshC
LTSDEVSRPTYGHAASEDIVEGALPVKAHCLPFSQIPHTSRLFADFLAYAPTVQQFYPRPPHFAEWVKEESGRISYDPLRRERVAAILERQNKQWEASPKTLANLDRFRRGAAAVVTGQQVGLFGGPMFSVYKALTAVKLAEEATAAGVDAVPIFWLATYDHDLAEVNHVTLPGPEGELQTITIPSHATPGAPVSAVQFGEEILPAIEQAAAVLGDSEATQFLRETYRPGETMGTAFARLFAKLFGDWGVIVLDASDPELHRIAEPIYRAAVEKAITLSDALVLRGIQLEAAGYHQQVKVAESSVLLFTVRNGARTPIHQRPYGYGEEQFAIGSEGNAEKISEWELLKRIESTPEDFSPNVLLRPIVEDYLLPTLTYTGGAAETAYFGQAGAVYELLLGRVTPIVPRYSATIVEPKVERLLTRYGIGVTDCFGGYESLRKKLAAHSLPVDLQVAFDTLKKSLDSNLASIKEKLATLDRTLLDAAETSGSKMQHQLEKLYSQAARAEAQKGALISRHADSLMHALYPDKGLQERAIGGIYYVARYGKELLQQIYSTIHTDCHDHQVVEL